ncbi:hypothetical protein [Flavobacterium sp. CAN_S2]|uniref:hypothetical protein n=1 Tax=Flavobacterium sp. CAN_S2 TaxID=2787726 RepID=UPI0018CAE37B
MNNYSITLKFENEAQTIYAIALSKNHSTTVVRNNEIDLEQTYFISVVHTELNSFLDLTGITPFQLIFFDSNLNFAGASFSTGNPNHLFTIQTTAKFILLIPFREKKKLNGLERFYINNRI